MNDNVRNEWHMMHFRCLEMDRCHVFLKGPATLYHTQVHGCLLVVHDAKNVRSELWMLILNSEWKDALIFIFRQKNNAVFVVLLYVHRQCSRVLSLCSFVSVDTLIRNIVIFIFTKLHEFVISEAAKRTVWSKISAVLSAVLTTFS